MRTHWLRLVGIALVWSAQVAAQQPASVQTERPAGPDPGAVQRMAPVVLDGVTLFQVRGTFAFPAEQRAAEIADRIRAFAADRSVPIESLTVRETPEATFVVVGDYRLFAVLDADGELEGLSRQVLADVSRTRVANAVRAFRHDREPARIWSDITRAVIATIVFAAVLWLTRRALRRFRMAMERRVRSKLHDVQFQKIEIVRGERLWQALIHTLRGVNSIITLVAAYLYLNYVLVLFPWTRALGNSLSGMLLRPLATLGNDLLEFIPDLIFLLVLALITRYALKLLSLLFQGISDGTVTLQGFEPDWARPTEKIARLGLIVFALVVAYPYIPGSGSEAFKGIGLILGLMFSLGSSSVIGNTLAGLSLAFRRAFRVGDRVKIGDNVGEVTQVGLLTTYLRSPKNEQIVVPNSLILNSEVVNFNTLAKQQGLILHTNVEIGYGTPWRQVEAMLLESARRTPGLASLPEPFVLQRGLGVSAVNYELNVFSNNASAMLALYSALHRNILDVFNEYGVQIMTPSYEGDPEEPKVVPPERWFASPATATAAERGVDGAAPALPTDAALTRQPEREAASAN